MFRRRVEAIYVAPRDPMLNDPLGPTLFDGSNVDLEGYGTTFGFSVTGMNRYFLNAGSQIHDHILIRARNLPVGDPAREQRIIVSDDPMPITTPLPDPNVAPDFQWQVVGWESSQLQGSNIRDAIWNNTNIPALVQGFEGNDTLVGGDTIDVIFSGAGAPRGPFDPMVPDVILNASAPPPATTIFVRPGDVLVGAGGVKGADGIIDLNDFLFADVDLFLDRTASGDFLWGLVTADVPGESDLIDGAGQGSAMPLQQINHAAQFGASDIVRNITGMLIDGGGIKDVLTWLTATPMTLDLTPGMTSNSLNMLIDQAFNANSPTLRKFGLAAAFNALFEDFEIQEAMFPAPMPAIAGDELDDSELATDVDAAFAAWGV
jgi:hypothetical protein